MPPQGLNLNEYGIESGVAAPQARKFAFLGFRSVERVSSSVERESRVVADTADIP